MSRQTWIRRAGSRLISLALILLSVAGPACAQRNRPLQPIAARLEPTRTIVYKQVSGRSLRMHLFEPPSVRPIHRRPVFLAIHGGGWTGGSARHFYPFADAFAKLGMLGVSLEYRLLDKTGETTVFDCVRDGRSAVRYLRQHASELRLDPKRIVVSGGSAGGHVAAGTALFEHDDESGEDLTISCRPDLLVLYYPVIDTSKNGYGQKKIGEHWRKLSPVEHVRPRLPPTIVFHGTADTVTPYAGAQLFQQRMRQAGNTCELISHPGGEHGYCIFDLKLYEATLQRTRSFLEEHQILEGQEGPHGH